MKKILNIFLILVLVASFASFLTPEPALARGEEKVKKVEKEVLASDEVRLDKYTKAKKVKEYETDGIKYTEYSAVINSLPETLDDLVTKITLEWREGKGLDGVDYLVTGNNIYWARVTGTRVSVEYESKQAAWDPIIIIGGKYLELKSGPTVVADPVNNYKPDGINLYYPANTVKWVYEWSTGGFLGIGARTVTITRYLRQIEGALLEYFVLDEDPEGDVQIKQNYKSEKGFKWTKPVVAWDADYNPIAIEDTISGKIVKASQLWGVEYPVTIDPTTSFTTSSSDTDGTGWSFQFQPVAWNNAHDGTTPTSYSSSGTLLSVGLQTLNNDEGDAVYSIYRTFLYFDTASLPDSSDISTSDLELYGYSNPYTQSTSWTAQLQTGGATYPHDPFVDTDWLYSHYSGDGGSLTSGSMGTGYKSLTLNTEGKGWINKTGATRFVLRDLASDIGDSARDVPNTSTYYKDYWIFYAYEQGTGYQPKLNVTYTIPVEVPEAQTDAASDVVDTYATLHGTVVDDGFAATSVRFKYGTSTGSYPYATSWDSGYYTDDTFYQTVYGLSKGTKYYFVAEVSNSAGSDLGSELTFLTKPGNPSSFTATPGDQENVLAWTLGTGATKTLIRFKTSGYPSDTDDGTQVYFDTGTGTTHSSLVNGTPYFYSAWAYAADGELTQYSLGYVTATGTPVFTGAPLVTTNPATDVEQTTATLHGYLDSLSGYATADVWFQYYKGAGSWTDYETATEQLSATGPFSKAITGLDADTLYHMRAAADGTGGTTYGSDITFTTGAISAPSMTTNSATGVTMTVATLHGTVTDDGGAVVTAWFQWGLTTAYGYTTDSGSGLYTDDTIYASLIGLDPSTEFHFRVVGQNSVGTSYGLDQTFTTDSPTAPTATTQDATSVGATSAILHGTVTGDGGVAVEARFQYGPNTGYGTDTGWMSGFYTNDTFEFLISGLTQGDTYHFRAQVKNITSTGSGADKEFTTQFGPPNEFKADAVSPTSVTLSWVNVGDQTAVFAKQGSFPADRLDGDQVNFGPEESASHGGLSSGNTYFYRAWSWKEGGVFSVGYSEDATTTMTLIVGEIPETPGEAIVGDAPPMPEEWFQDPSGSAFSSWKFLDIIDSTAISMEMPSGGLWLILTMVVISAIGLFIFAMSGSLLVVIMGMGGVISLAAFMGLIPLWTLLGLIIIGGSFAYFMRQGGA